MTTFLMIRHGESESNNQKAFAGHLNANLSDIGHEQAERTATYISEHFTVDAIFSSDLLRAYQTAEHIGNKLGLSVQTDSTLREINAGDWEGVKFDDLETRFAKDYTVWLTDIGNATCTNGESPKDVQERVHPWLLNMAREYAGKTVVVTTHAVPIRTMQCIWEGRPLSDMKDIPWVNNASVTVVEYENGSWNLKAVNIDGHLAEFRTVPAANV